jgi:hypothetical protein
MKKFIFLVLSAISGTAAAITIWIVALALGDHHPILLGILTGGARSMFRWDLLGLLLVLYTLFMFISRKVRSSRAARTRWLVAFLFAFLTCTYLSFYKVYVDRFVADAAVPPRAHERMPAL